jgi:hypothetical protein
MLLERYTIITHSLSAEFDMNIIQCSANLSIPALINISSIFLNFTQLNNYIQKYKCKLQGEIMTPKGGRYFILHYFLGLQHRHSVSIKLVLIQCIQYHLEPTLKKNPSQRMLLDVL